MWETNFFCNALSSRKWLSSWLGHILQYVISMLNRLSWSTVAFIKRSVNTIAQVLARYAKDQLEDVVCTEESPPPIVEDLSFDSTSIK